MKNVSTAALAGVAPINNDSGQAVGKRSIKGGRYNVRCMLYQAALVASTHNQYLKVFAKRLKQKGKPHKVVLIAVARKILVIANTLVAVIMMTTFVAGPFYLTYVLGFSAGAVGLVMAVGPIISILSGLPSGMMADRFGVKRVAYSGLILVFCGALVFAFLLSVWGLTGYIVALVLLTPGYQLFLSANNMSVMSNVHDSRRGLVSGVLNMSRNGGLIIGASIISILFSLGSGTSSLAQATPAAIEGAFRLVFLTNAAFIVLALFILEIGARQKSQVAV